MESKASKQASKQASNSKASKQATAATVAAVSPIAVLSQAVLTFCTKPFGMPARKKAVNVSRKAAFKGAVRLKKTKFVPAMSMKIEFSKSR